MFCYIHWTVQKKKANYKLYKNKRSNIYCIYCDRKSGKQMFNSMWPITKYVDYWFSYNVFFKCMRAKLVWNIRKATSRIAVKTINDYKPVSKKQSVCVCICVCKQHLHKVYRVKSYWQLPCVWPGSVMVRALDMQPNSHGSDPRLFCFQPTTMDKLFLHMCLCHPSSNWFQSRGGDPLWLGR